MNMRHLLHMLFCTLGVSCIPNIAAAKELDLTWGGLTLYGTLDMGLAHQTHGVPLSPYSPLGVEYIIQKNSNNAVTTPAPNGLSQSKIGLKGKKDFGIDWSGVIKLETGIVPTSGNLADGLKSLANNNGTAWTSQTSSIDSGRAGQLFQGAAFAGLSSQNYGTLTFGRQTSILTDNIIRYDPHGLSYAFSALPGVAAGSGTPENVILDGLLKYSGSPAGARLGVAYQFRNAENGGGSGYQLSLGKDYSRLSLDVVYANMKGAVSSASLSATQYASLAAAGRLQANSLSATISDNLSLTMMGKYDMGRNKLYVGFERINFSNPATPLLAGAKNIGGYVLSATNNNAYATDKILDIAWGGLGHAFTEQWSLTLAYYRYSQNSFNGSGVTSNGCSNSSLAQCSGTLDDYSMAADYKLSKYWDFYGGMMWSGVKGGLSSGFLNSSTLCTMLGARLMF